MGTWSAAYEAAPAQADAPSTLGTTGRGTRSDLRERYENEHSSYTSKGGSSGGTVAADMVHKKGSARAFYQASAPTLRPDGVTALGSGDDGRLFVKSGDKGLWVWNGSAFVVVNLDSSVALSVASVTSAGAISGTTITGSGNVTGAGFTTGDVVVKYKKLTGTTNGTGLYTSSATGIIPSKVLSMDAVIYNSTTSAWMSIFSGNGDTTAYIQMNSSGVVTAFSDGYLYYPTANASIRILITYEA